jgi:hypothetical protein
MVVVDTILRKLQLTAVRKSVMDRFVLSKALTDGTTKPILALAKLEVPISLESWKDVFG